MRSIKGLIIFSAILGLAAAGWAEGEVQGTAGKQGIRIAIRNAPGLDEVELSLGGASETVDLDSQDGVQVDVMYAKRFMGEDGNRTVGPMIAGGVFFSNSSGTFAGDTDEIELTAFGAIVEGGVAVQLGRVVVLEVAPFLGLGVANQSYSIEGESISDGSGPYFLYGVKGGIFFQIGSNIELGLEAGYSGFTCDGEIEEFGGPTMDLTFTGGGFQGAGVLVVKF